jgi:hypothetical protein
MTYYVSATEPNRLMLSVETVAVYWGEREREEKVGRGVVKDTTVLEGGVIETEFWQFGRFPGSAR